MTDPDLRSPRCGATFLAGLTLLWAPVAAADAPAGAPVPADSLDTGAETGPAAGPEASSSSSLTIDLTAGMWLARLNGSVRLGRGAGVSNISMENEFDLDDAEASFNGELTVRFLDGWTARFNGYDFSTDASGPFLGGPVRFGEVTLLPGDPYRSSVDVESYAAELAYDIWHPVSDSTADLRAGIMGGVRYLEVRQTVEIPGSPKQKGDGQWVAIYGGAEFELLLNPSSGPLAGREIAFGVGVAAGLDVNGDNGIYVQVRGGVTVEIVRHVNVNVGYRFLHADFTDGDYTFDGGLRGLFVGGTVRF